MLSRRRLLATPRVSRVLALTLACAAASLAGVSAGAAAAGRAAAPRKSSVLDAPANWPAYDRTLAGDRYAPLTEISRANVARLRLECTYTLPEVGAFETGPIVVDGTMYFTTDERSFAIDAATCKPKWTHFRRSSRPSLLHVDRGFAYLAGRLFRGTSDGHVIALEASTGRELWDHTIEPNGPGVSIPMAPIAADGKVFVGNAGGDNAGVTGHVYALDARDGHLLWSFDVVPASVRDSWTNTRLPITGGAFWTSFTFDRAKGILYVPAGNPAPDFDSLDRTGADLYSDSIIALDAATGRMIAYNQLVRHDSHDWDVDSPPTLVTTKSGREIIASANKDGLLSILDRGGVELAMPVPSGGGTTVIPLLSQTPTTTRTNVSESLSRSRAVRFCPGIMGGVEWNGAAYSPLSNSLFVAAVDWCARVQIVRHLKVPPRGQIWFGSAIPMAKMFDPASAARGRISAFDAESGSLRWQLETPHPMLAGVTPTASGLLFAADLGGVIYAIDQRSGRVLWQASTGQAIGGGIISYDAGGHERIAVASGMKSSTWPGAAAHSRILVYGLE